MLGKVAAAMACLAWGLWLGGLGALFLFASRLFAEDRETALKAAPILFLNFERYQLFLAAAALMATVVWRVRGGGMGVSFLFWMLAIATAGAALSPILITSRMERLREQGRAGSAEFMKWHGISMAVYSAEVVVLVAGGMGLPWAMGAGDCDGGREETPRKRGG